MSSAQKNMGGAQADYFAWRIALVGERSDQNHLLCPGWVWGLFVELWSSTNPNHAGWSQR